MLDQDDDDYSDVDRGILAGGLFALPEKVGKPAVEGITPKRIYPILHCMVDTREGREYLIEDDFGEKVLIREGYHPSNGAYKWIIAIGPKRETEE